MNNNTIVTPSSQVNSTLPDYINETYKEFVKFIQIADQSEERIGFSQDLLQNLPKPGLYLLLLIVKKKQFYFL